MSALGVSYNIISKNNF